MVVDLPAPFGPYRFVKPRNVIIGWFPRFQFA